MKQETIAGKTMYFCTSETGGPLILFAMYPGAPQEFDHLWECLLNSIPENNFVLMGFEGTDWNREFSPWKGEAAFGEEAFAGGGTDTLVWLKEECIPWLNRTFERNRRPCRIYLSLGGKEERTANRKMASGG